MNKTCHRLAALILIPALLGDVPAAALPSLILSSTVLLIQSNQRRFQEEALSQEAEGGQWREMLTANVRRSAAIKRELAAWIRRNLDLPPQWMSRVLRFYGVGFVEGRDADGRWTREPPQSFDVERIRKRALHFMNKRLGHKGEWNVREAHIKLDSNIRVLKGLSIDKNIFEAAEGVLEIVAAFLKLPELSASPRPSVETAKEDDLLDRTLVYYLENALQKMSALKDDSLDSEEQAEQAISGFELLETTLSTLMNVQEIILRKSDPLDVMDIEAMKKKLDQLKKSSHEGISDHPSVTALPPHALDVRNRYAAENRWFARTLHSLSKEKDQKQYTVVDLSFGYPPLATSELADSLSPQDRLIGVNSLLPAVVVHVWHEPGEIELIKPFDAYFDESNQLLSVSLSGNMRMSDEQIASLAIECKRDLDAGRDRHALYHDDLGNSIHYAPLESFKKPNLEFRRGGFDLPLKIGELADMVRIFSPFAIEQGQEEGVVEKIAPHIRTGGYLVLGVKNITGNVTQMLIFKKASDGKLDYDRMGLMMPASLSRPLRWSPTATIFARYRDLWDLMDRMTETISHKTSIRELQFDMAQALRQQGWVVNLETDGGMFLELNPNGSLRIAYPDKKSLRAGLDLVRRLIVETLSEDGSVILTRTAQDQILRAFGRYHAHLARALMALAQDEVRAKYLPAVLQILNKTVDIFGDLGRNLTEEVLVKPLMERPDLWLAAFRELNEHPDLSSHQKKRADTKLERFLRYHVRGGPNCFGQSTLQSAWDKNCKGAALAIISLAESYLSGDIALKRVQEGMIVPGNPLKSMFARKLGKPWLVQLLAEQPGVLGQIWPKLRRYQLTFEWLCEESMFGDNAMLTIFHDDPLAAARLLEVVGSVEEKRLRESRGSLGRNVLFADVLPGHRLTIEMLRGKAQLAPRELADFLSIVKNPKSKASLYQLTKPSRLGWEGLSSELLVHGKELIDLLRLTEPSSAFYDEEIGIAGELLFRSLSVQLKDVYQRRILAEENLASGWEQPFAAEAQAILNEWAGSRVHRFLLEHLLPLFVKSPRPGYVIRKYLVFEIESREGNLGFYINVRSPKSSSRIHGNTADISLLMPLTVGDKYDAFAAPERLTPWDRQMVPLELRSSFSLLPYRAEWMTNNPGAYRIRNESEHLVIEFNLFLNRHYIHITDYVPVEGKEKENEYVESSQWASMHNMPVHTQLIMGAKKLDREEADAAYAQVVKAKKAFPIFTTQGTAIVDPGTAQGYWEKYRPDVWLRSNGKLLFEPPPSAPSPTHHEPHKLAVAA